MVEKNLALGLNLSTSPLNQPKGTYRYAENIVTDKENQGSVTNEKGLAPYMSFIGNIIGSCFISPEEQVIFTDQDYIYLVNTELKTQISYLIEGANFSSPISAESKIVNGYEKIVYFTDGVNPRRFFNFDKIDNFKVNGQFDLEKFKIDRFFTPPKITTVVKSSGGNLRYGVYNFVIQYLDEDENILYTSPVDINYTPIGDTSNSGALNIDTNNVDAGGKPESNKSILLTVSDTGNAEYARVIAIRTTTSDGFTSDAHVVGGIINIEGNSFTYTYTGYNPERGDFTISKNEVLVQNSRYKTALVQEQIQNRLVQANLTEDKYDPYLLQSYANKIKVKWVAKLEKADGLKTTRLGGDKKALGVVYIYEDGTYSNVHLIPVSKDKIVNYISDKTYTFVIRDNNSTRTTPLPYTIKYKLEGDDRIYTNEGSLPGVMEELIIFTTDREIEVLSFDTNEPAYVTYRIDVTTNTNIPAVEIDDSPIEGYYASGNTGAAATNQYYKQPENADCKDSQYWEDYTDLSVNIHVLPNRSRLQLHNNDFVVNIGFLFENVEYPENVIGHFFVESTASDIEAKGIITPFFSSKRDWDRGSYFHKNGNEDPVPEAKVCNLITPEFLYTKSSIGGDRLQIEGSWNYEYRLIQGEYDFSDSGTPYKKLTYYINYYKPIEYTPTLGFAREIESSIILPPNSYYDGFENKSVSNAFNILELSEGLSFRNYSKELIRYVTIYKDTGSFDNIYSLQFRRITENGENVSFHGDAFVSPIQLDNVVRTSYKNRFLAKDTVTFDTEIITTLYIESRINTQWLHDGLNECDQHYKESYEDKDRLFIQRKAILDDIDKPVLREPVCPFWYGYNKDYSRISDFNVFSLDKRTFDYCSEVMNIYPTRIIYSERSFSETLKDGYREFKANNYVDLPASKGSIQGMNLKNNQLWIRTQYSCFIITPNPQELQLQGTTVEIGTGDFLSIPEQELNAVDIGYGGQMHPHESINTEHGLIWVDRSRKKVLMVTNQLSEISRNGMFDFFFNQLEVNEHIRLGYDPINERLLLTNLDKNTTISYCFLSKVWKSFHSYKPEYYLFDKSCMYSYNKEESMLYSHDSTQYLNSTTEIILKDVSPFTIDTVSYYAKHYNGKTVVDTTFNEALIYNTKQCSGYKTVSNNPYYIYNPETVRLVKKNNLHTLSPFRDLAIGTPVLNDNQEPNIDITIPQVQHKKFNDRWAGVRLIDKSGNKYVLDYIETMKYYIELKEIASKNQLG